MLLSVDGFKHDSHHCDPLGTRLPILQLPTWFVTDGAQSPPSVILTPFSLYVVAMGSRGEQMFQDDEDMFSNKKEHRNPLVLCGAIATAGVLLAGLVSFKQGNYNRSQMFMRARVGFQAATVALMVGTVALQDKSTASNVTS